jgi:excisionase family DNA binding protein
LEEVFSPLLQQAAEFLGVTTRKLKDLCRQKRITHSRPDYRTYRFIRADLDAWLEQYRMHERS